MSNISFINEIMQSIAYGVCISRILRISQSKLEKFRRLPRVTQLEEQSRHVSASPLIPNLLLAPQDWAAIRPGLGALLPLTGMGEGGAMRS